GLRETISHLTVALRDASGNALLQEDVGDLQFAPIAALDCNPRRHFSAGTHGAASLDSPRDQVQVSFELNRCGFRWALVIQLHFDREKPGNGTDSGRGVLVKNKLRTTEMECIVTLCAGRRRIEQNIRCSRRRCGPTARARDYGHKAARIADDI